jgi:hypothetical protein
MSKSAVTVSYAQSLLWSALFVAITVGASSIVELVFVDFVHGNPNRSQGNAIFMMVVETPLISAIAIIGFFLVFTLPQLFQTAVINVLNQQFDDRARFAVFLALPLTAVLTWYCYDYLTPSDLNLGINVGPDWTPYQHGISRSRYMGALEFQAPVTLFGFLYLDADIRGVSKKTVIIATLAIAIAAGIIRGHFLAQHQYQFLS